jgi:hypothetical protein
MKWSALWAGCAAVAAAVTLAAGAVQAQQPPAAGHEVIAATDVVWGAGPPALPPGGRMAVLSGDPTQPGPYVLRAQMPAGYRIAPHWHPTDENLTVLSGTFAIGMGETFDEKALKDMEAGAFTRMPATMRHYALARTPVVLQIHGTGPFVLTYVNPADDPRGAAAKP